MTTEQLSEERPRRRNNRRLAVLDAAARRFRMQGYAAATMRDIASDAGMLPGSLYYHYPAKSALLVAVHEEGVRRIADAVDLAVDGVGDPWGRLEAALTAHLETLLNGADYSLVVLRDLPADEPELRKRLVGLRDSYEVKFKKLCRDLPIADPDSERWLRMMVLGAANWVRTWYRPLGPDSGETPAGIARRFVRLLKGSPE